MAKGKFDPIKQELLASGENDPTVVRTVIRVLHMSARERIRSFSEGKFSDSVWTLFGYLSRKYAASKNFCHKGCAGGFAFLPR
jgi:hypothetical protein